MGRLYTISSPSATVIANGTVTSVRPGATLSLNIRRCWVGFSGAATSAQERVQIATQASAFGTLAAVTPRALNQSDPTSIITGGTAQAAQTAGVTASVEAAGAKVALWPEAFNVLNGWLWVPTPDEVIRTQAGSALAYVVNFLGTPSVLTDWTYGMVFEEL